MAENDVHTGKLLCSSCGIQYPIENGIPDFLTVADHLRNDGGKHEEVREANVLAYDSRADGYSPEKVEGFSSVELRARLGKLSPEACKGRLLDLGCGTGLVATFAQPLFQQIVGIDVSMGMLRQVTSAMDPVRGDMCLLPFKEKTFDCVTAVAALHHVYDTSRVLRESFRVLKPGGYLYTDIDHNRRFFCIYGSVMRLQQALEIHLLPDRDMTRGFGSSSAEILKVPKEIVALAEYHQCQGLGIDPLLIRESAREIGFSSVRLEWKVSRNPRLTKLERVLNLVLSMVSHTPLARYTSSHFSLVAMK